MNVQMNKYSVSFLLYLITEIEKILIDKKVVEYTEDHEIRMLRRIRDIARDLQITVLFDADLHNDIEALCIFKPGTIRGYCIILNRNVLTKDPNIHAAILHELSHILAEDPWNYYSSEDEPNDLFQSLDKYRSNSLIYDLLEMKTELLVAVLAFSPKTLFAESFYQQGADFKAIASVYNMPLDCCIKWTLITMRQFDGHYFKYCDTCGQEEDRYIPQNPFYRDFSWKSSARLLANSTVAQQCFRLKKDIAGQSHSELGEATFHCQAYYVDNGTCEKLLVVGWPLEVYDSLPPPNRSN